MGSKLFLASGAWQKVTVPKGVTIVNITTVGAGSNGLRRGGRVTGRLKVKAGQVLYAGVGVKGAGNSSRTGGGGGWPNGARGGDGLNALGGDGGGGCSVVRSGSTTGTLICVAGGAGGNSGDNGKGGRGGAATGESGARGSAGSGQTAEATGGTQTQGGNGGVAAASRAYRGYNASDVNLSRGGVGGASGTHSGPGGGGGGGGFHSGGGGHGGATGDTPGGGGGGGANYTGGLDVVNLNEQGTGSLTAGTILITWDDPAPANLPPTSPSNVTPAPGAATKSTSSVTVRATVNDPNKSKVAIRVYVYDYKGKTLMPSVLSPYVATGKKAAAKLTGLSQNTHYFVKVYAVDPKGLRSTNYAATNFWTNRSPLEPSLHTPANFASFDTLQSLVFTWTHNDPDGDKLKESEIMFHRDGAPAADDRHDTILSTQASYTTNPGFFKSNTFYYWSVRTKDTHGLWGQWAEFRQFYITGTTVPPLLLEPTDTVVRCDGPVRFTWKFRDPDPGDSQAKADFRYRVKDSADWFTLFGTTGSPGGTPAWTLPAGTLRPDYQYQWSVRTYDALSGGSTPSEWADTETFHTILTPGGASGDTPVVSEVMRGVLGQGTYRVHVYERGGHRRIGELGPIRTGTWSRVRDDISKALIKVEPQSSNEDFLAHLESWRHELVVYRDDQRVWEGPITRIEYGADYVDVEASDVMAWVYRRIMRKGYNDAGKAKRSVVDRAALLIEQALGRDDPNILQYLTTFNYPDDTEQARVREGWSSTTWDEVDDLAATAGLDYVVVGRRIILWDTHRPIGKLSVMSDRHFSAAPVVTQYGMNLATLFGVTNNAGAYGAIVAEGVPGGGKDPFYGLVEHLASAYGDTSQATGGALTPAQRIDLTTTLTNQARRNIQHRYPTPLIVRVPDGTTLSPDTPVDIQHLVPGVWVPLHAEQTIRKVRQWQKLDQVSVTWDSDGEKVAVSMSPAPRRGQDPDSDDAATDAAAAG